MDRGDLRNDFWLRIPRRLFLFSKHIHEVKEAVKSEAAFQVDSCWRCSQYLFPSGISVDILAFSLAHPPAFCSLDINFRSRTLSYFEEKLFPSATCGDCDNLFSHPPAAFHLPASHWALPRSNQSMDIYLCFHTRLTKHPTYEKSETQGISLYTDLAVMHFWFS